MYTCPMHAEVRQAGPGRCPKCGMNLVPVTEGTPRNSALAVGACLLLAVATYFLWTQHRSHLLGVLPWLFLLACPFMHWLMHRGHRSHAHADSGASGAGQQRHQHGSHGHC